MRVDKGFGIRREKKEEKKGEMIISVFILKFISPDNYGIRTDVIIGRFIGNRINSFARFG
jgi:hypothetical protein